MTAEPSPSSSAQPLMDATVTTTDGNTSNDDDVEAAIQNHNNNNNNNSNQTNNSNKSPSNSTADLLNEEDDDDDDNNSRHSRSSRSSRGGTGLSMRRAIKKKLAQPSSSHPTTSGTTTPSNGSGILQIPPATKAPKQTLQAVYAAGKYKAGLTLNVLCVQSFMAGIYIAAAGHLYLAVGGGILGSALFPGGLIAVILTSAELFTGDALIFVAAVLGKQVPITKLLRNWTVAWISNFVGSVAWAYFLGYLSGAIEDSHAKELSIAIAEKKALNAYWHILLKGIGANFMVCVAVWQGTCAEEVAGKVLALWFPTAAFVMMGFDHVVANMFLIPIGMMYGANVSVGRMFAALFTATLGNAIGGGIFVGAVYWYVFDSMASFGGLTSRIRQNMRGTFRGSSIMARPTMTPNASYRSGAFGLRRNTIPPSSTAATPIPPNNITQEQLMMEQQQDPSIHV